jgi:hypothetical protein
MRNEVVSSSRKVAKVVSILAFISFCSGLLSPLAPSGSRTLASLEEARIGGGKSLFAQEPDQEGYMILTAKKQSAALLEPSTQRNIP